MYQSKRQKKTIEILSKLNSIASVMTFGGEPLLYPEVTCAIHKKAAQCGIEERQIITNGYFTKNDKKCKEVAQALGQANVTDLLISVDAFHQEFIPIEYVYSFAMYAQNVGIPNIRFHPAWVLNQQHENSYNKKTRKILKKFSNLDIAITKGNNIFMAGNATAYLAEYYEKPNFDPTVLCGMMPYTESLTNITSLSIEPNGNVMVCGFIIGNIYKEKIDEIISRYNPYENEFMNAILTGGGPALLELANRKGIMIDCRECASVCDLCFKINDFRNQNITE